MTEKEHIAAWEEHSQKASDAFDKFDELRSVDLDEAIKYYQVYLEEYRLWNKHASIVRGIWTRQDNRHKEWGRMNG